MMVQAQEEMGEGSADEAVNEEIDDSLERAATTATSLDVEQDRGNINKTQSRATPNELSFIGTSSGVGPRRQDTMRDTIAQTRVFDLENTKTSQAQEIISFKKRVRLEKKKRSRTHRLKRLYKVSLSARVKSSDDNEESLEPEMPMKKKDQISLDEELTFKLQAEEERIAREKAQQVKEKVENDKDSKELKKCLEIILNDEDDVTTDATPLSSNKMLKKFNREDLEVLWRLVKARFEKVQPVDHMDSFSMHNLKTMFEHHVEDNNTLYYLLVEKMYLLTNHTLHQMFNDVKLQVDYECEMAYNLLRLVKKQLKEGYVPQ
uniref:Uncharacterized protein n=1 Tax=Tanacetum cinerariifolium TaxID=118510 RepID=A0A699HNM1_TANCI|nr:hypothetical protein [Tanacetum cinerariifolium]